MVLYLVPRFHCLTLEIKKVRIVSVWDRSTLNQIGSDISCFMRIISKKRLREFYERYEDAEQSLLSWYREVEKEDWDTPAEVKEKYRSASILGDNRVVFNIKGNKYRLVVKIKYEHRVVYIRFVGAHAQYDAIDAEEV